MTGKAKGPVPHKSSGRRPVARPGKVRGVELRSQLEVEFATALEDRHIRWRYEPERVGAGGYLVDFYLPDYKCWVEVKGRFEYRDELLLPNVAIHLKRERGERLFLYMKSKAYRVGTQGFVLLTHDEFWADILKPPEAPAGPPRPDRPPGRRLWPLR